VLNLVDRVLEVYREPTPDSAAPFGWRYARIEVFDAAAHVIPLAAPGSSIPVSRRRAGCCGGSSSRVITRGASDVIAIRKLAH
jgi:hypothetical protein